MTYRNTKFRHCNTSEVLAPIIIIAVYVYGTINMCLFVKPQEHTNLNEAIKR